MVAFKTAFVAVAALLSSPIVASPGPIARPHGLIKRQAPAVDPACQGLTYSSGNGGRKIAIVVDSSGSNVDTDPDDLRVVAAKSLNDVLISQAEATADKKADLVTIVDFDGSADVIYPLGDPNAAASAALDQIDSSGGTSIASGVEDAIIELTKPGNDPTANRTGIIVLTDGQDSSSSALITQLNKAKDAGIRVNFGFLDPGSSSAKNANILAAILATGGIHATINSAASQQSFISQVLSHGLTGLDAGASVSSTLVSGLSIAAAVESDGENEFTYTGTAGEKLNISVSVVTPQTLSASVKDASGKELATAQTDKTTNLVFDVTQTGLLALIVKSSNTSSGSIFTVGLNSSLGIANCTLPPKNSTTPPTNGTSPGGSGGSGSGSGSGGSGSGSGSGGCPTGNCPGGCPTGNCPGYGSGSGSGSGSGGSGYGCQTGKCSGGSGSGSGSGGSGYGSGANPGYPTPSTTGRGPAQFTGAASAMGVSSGALAACAAFAAALL